MRLLPLLAVLVASIFQATYTSVNANCSPHVDLYDLDTQTSITTLLVEGESDDDGSFALPQVDLHDLSGVSLTLVANFCTGSVKSAKFVVYDYFTEAVVASSVEDKAPSFQMRGLNSKPPAFLTTPGIYFISVFGYGKTDAHGAPFSALQLRLQVLPKRRVSEIAMVDTNTGNDVATTNEYIFEGVTFLTFDLNKLPANPKLSIRVKNTIGNVSSVDFTLVGYGASVNNTNYTYFDNKAPFGLAGDSAKHYNPAAILSKPGTYDLTTTAYPGSQKQGASGSVSFGIIIEGFRFSGYPMLVDATTNTKLFSLESPYIDLSDYPANTTFTILPQVEGTGASIEYKLFKYLTSPTNPQEQTPVPVFRSLQTKSPYSLGGQAKSGQYISVPALLHSGIFSLEATAYAGPNKQYPSDSQSTDFIVLPTFSVTGFSLVNANTGKSVHDLADFIDLSEYPANAAFTISASTKGHVGSVAFRLSRYNESIGQYVDFATTVANHAPFTLDGKSTTSKYYGVPALLVPGDYRLYYTVYGKPNQQGDESITSSVDFLVLPRLDVTTLELVEASTKAVLDPNVNAIDLRDYAAQETFSIVAKTPNTVKSVEFTLYRYNDDQTETTIIYHQVVNGPTFALKGMSKNGSYVPVELLKVAGFYRLSATPYSLVNKGGTKGATWDQDFYVAPRFGVDVVELVDASSGKDLMSLGDNVLALSEYPKGTAFDIDFIFYGSVGSVEFELSRMNDAANKTYSIVKSSVDSTAPFTVSAASKHNYTAVSNLRVPGLYQLKVTPYTLSNKSGAQGLTNKFEFRVTDFPKSCYAACGEYYVFDLDGSYCSCDPSCFAIGNCCIDYCDHCVSLNATLCK